MKAPEILLLASLLTASALGADVGGTVRTNWETTGTLWESGTYAYDAAGNVKQIGADRYAYDQYGRLVSATANTPSSPNTQAFTYDRYGNLKSMTTTSASGTFRGAFAVVPSTNRLDGTCEQPYDVCHSRLHHPDTGAETGRYTAGEYQWDALGMLKELNGDRHERHLYDASDERIVTIQYTGNVEMTRRYSLRAADNKVLRELTLNVPANTWTVDRDYVHRGSTLMAAFTGTEAHPTRHYHPDHLGTPRVVTDADGYRLNIHTYLPFGREAEGSEPDTERLKFTGHERDSSGPASPGFDLDYMHARFYDPNVGRFLSVDPAWESADPHAPQTWNRYTYAWNNPLKFIDPTGENATVICDENSRCTASVIVQVVADPNDPAQVATANAYKQSTESYWNGRTETGQNGEVVTFNFSISVVAPGQQQANMDTLTVVNGTGRSNIQMTLGPTSMPDTGTLFTNDNTGNQSGMAGIGPHESGHLLGLRDLYAPGEVVGYNPAPGVDIMRFAQPTNGAHTAFMVLSPTNLNKTIHHRAPACRHQPCR